MNQKHKDKDTSRSSFFLAIELLLVFSFFVSLHKAVFAPVVSDYLKIFVLQDNKIALLEGLANIIIVAVNLLAVQIVLRVGKVRLLLGLFVVLAGVDVLFAHVQSTFWVTCIYFVFLASYRLVWFCLNLLVKRYSSDEHIHANEGKVYVMGNIGWIIGPAIGGWVASDFGFRGLFYFMALVSIFAFVVGWQRRHVFDPIVPSKIKGSLNLITDLNEYVQNKELLLHFAINTFLFAYYSLMAIYFPLYLLENGYSFSLVGIAVSLSMLPFILEYPIGELADRFGGEETFFAFGFLLIACGLSALGLTSNIAIATLLYALASVGAAMIESLNESLFLRRVYHHKTAMLGIFSTASTIGWVAGMVICGFVLSFVGLRLLFVSFVPVMFLAAFSSLKLKK